MGLLEVCLKANRECSKPTQNEFVDNVGNKVSTTSTSVQPSGIIVTIERQKPENGVNNAQNEVIDAVKNPLKSNTLDADTGFVDVVACVRGSESAILTTLSSKKPSTTPVCDSSLARASDFVDKLSTCTNCPACGHWDGYGPWKMGPGLYCFFSAYFKGKPARPVPAADASEACPKIEEEEN